MMTEMQIKLGRRSIERRVKITVGADGDLNVRVEWMHGKWADADDWYWDLLSDRDQVILEREVRAEAREVAA